MPDVTAEQKEKVIDFMAREKFNELERLNRNPFFQECKNFCRICLPGLLRVPENAHLRKILKEKDK